jgi:DNA (cytosine-5)-methyltransferase 1
MGIDWMTGDELSQAIPPAYTEYIGRELMKVLASTEAER